MTTPTLDEQVAELMRLVEEYGQECYADAALGFHRNTEKSTLSVRATVEAFARAALERPAVPDGWRLVPVELTPEMVAAWASACAGPPEPGKSYSTEETRNIVAAADWKAMLNAAPPAPKEIP